MTSDYDPFDPADRSDPYPTYRTLRDTAPVHRAPRSGTWCVSRYEDALGVLRDPATFSSRAMFTVLMNGGKEGFPPLSWDMLKFLSASPCASGPTRSRSRRCET